MKLLTSTAIALIISLNLMACSGLSRTVPKAPTGPTPVVATDPSNALVGEYHYTGFDENGVKIIEGRLTIASVEPRRIGKETQIQIKGDWEFKEVVHRDHIGFQVGGSDLNGDILNGEVVINLNPNISDANVYLKGNLVGNKLSGTWSFNGYEGPVTHGTFAAVKK
jgi:hypothetical protein